MSAKEPVVRFSPFEALFIGEKNRILKRQPMKNTIFITRLNQRRKTINLRDLFDLEKSTPTNSNDIIFKVPQRICDFLKHRKFQNSTHQSTTNEENEIFCYEFEEHKVIAKNNYLPMKSKNVKVKCKIKLKRKFNDNIKGKIVKKFATVYESKCKTFALKNTNSKQNRHSLRGKDGKFICKSEFEKLRFNKISPKQKYLSNYLHQLYTKKNRKFFTNVQLGRNESCPTSEMPFSVEAMIGLSNLQFDVTASETTLNKISEKYYENNCHKDFQFPNFPCHLEQLDFENDSYLIDLIYENFPKILKFQSESQNGDFSEALLDSDILKPEKNVKMYEKKKNGFIKEEEIREILNRGFPLIKFKQMSDIMANHCHIKNEKNLCATKIDEPYTRRSHLITGKSFGSFFFRSAEGKDIFIGNLMKPFLQNSWFGSLPES